MYGRARNERLKMVVNALGEESGEKAKQESSEKILYLYI